MSATERSYIYCNRWPWSTWLCSRPAQQHGEAHELLLNLSIFLSLIIHHIIIPYYRDDYHIAKLCRIESLTNLQIIFWIIVCSSVQSGVENGINNFRKENTICVMCVYVYRSYTTNSCFWFVIICTICASIHIYIKLIT